MKKSGCVLVTLAVLSVATPAFAENRAVEVSINGIGPAVDAAAYQKVRRVIGNAIAKGVIDKFIVYGYGIEGGFSACAEAAAPHGQVKKLGAFVRRLRSIHPNPETTAYSMKLVESCASNEVVCPQDAKQCSDGSFVSRVLPSCEFAACPAE
jgi:hypothetical protein